MRNICRLLLLISIINGLLFVISQDINMENTQKEWNVLQEQIGELNTRVPNLDCNPENWDKLSDKELFKF